MSVISVKEDWRERTDRSTADGRTAPRVFTVVFDSNNNANKRPILARKARDPNTKLSIPQKGKKHPYDRGMYVREVFGKCSRFTIVRHAVVCSIGVETQKIG